MLTTTINPNPNIRVEVYGADGQLVGELAKPFESPRDVFLGAEYENGISAIVIRSRTLHTSAEFQLAHVQYGAVPEPSSFLLATVGLVTAILARRK